MHMFFPIVRRKLLDPLYHRATHTPKRRYWQKLEQTQYLPVEILRERQWQRLTALLQNTYENNAFYRRRFQDAGIHPCDIKSPPDFKNIPLLTKKEIRRYTTDMITSGYSRESLLNFRTGGSTGKPLSIYITEECSEIRNACARRHDRWSGWELGEPVAAVWGNPVLPKDPIGKMKYWLLTPTIFLDTMQVNEESVRQFARDWDRTRPTLMFGHSHSIYLLATYVRDMGIESIAPKAIITSSMMLMPHERQIIEKVFGRRVFDRYGCEEVSLIASECEKHDGMHLNIEHLFVEFIKENGDEAREGESGKIVVTDLMNTAMPFIRYQVEDVGEAREGSCLCGRGLPLMNRVLGRTADFLVRKDGTKVAGVSLIENTLTRLDGIEQMQIVQESLDQIVLNLVAGPGFGEHVKRALLDYLGQLFMNQVHIEISLLSNIPPDPTGKYRFSICKLAVAH